MANVDVIMPQMGESITEGTLVKWLKQEGDRVSRDEPLFEISTEKVDVEIPAPAAGILRQIKVKEGDTVPVNTVVAVIDKDGSAAVEAKPAGGEVVSLEARRGPGAPAAVAAPAPAPAAAAAAAPAAATVAAPTAAAAASAPQTREEHRRVRSSPLVRKIAREHGVEVADVSGTGLSGRVTKDDMLAHVARAASAPSAAPGVARSTPATAPAPAPAAKVAAAAAPAPRLAGRVEPMSAIRKKIAEHMVASRRTSAHVATVFEMDMARVHQLREKNKGGFEEKHGVKLTYTAIIAQAVVRALQEYPVLNASIDGDNVVYHEHVNLGIAVALDWGLLVPVVKHAEEKNVLGLQRAITDLAERARSRKLQPDEVQGGTFTITNPGIYGGLFGTPIIPQPQVAILGLGAIEKRPVVIDDAIAIRPMAYFALSFDHRLIDGAVADQFMAFLKKHLSGMEELG